MLSEVACEYPTVRDAAGNKSSTLATLLEFACDSHSVRSATENKKNAPAMLSEFACDYPSVRFVAGKVWDVWVKGTVSPGNVPMGLATAQLPPSYRLTINVVWANKVVLDSACSKTTVRKRKLCEIMLIKIGASKNSNKTLCLRKTVVVGTIAFVTVGWLKAESSVCANSTGG